MKLSDIKKSKVAHLNEHLFLSDKENDKKEKRLKFGNEKVFFDDQEFDSIKERDRYITLRYRATAGEIKDMARQVEFILEMDDKKVCSYFADYTYTVVKTNEFVVEDVKSKATRRIALYRLKKKLMLAQYKIQIKEV